MVERNSKKSKYNKNRQLRSGILKKLNKELIMELLIAICFVALLSVSSTTVCYAKAKKVNAYGYDTSGKWSYHIMDSKKKTVEIRPATLDKPINGINKGNVTIPTKIKIKGKYYTVVKISKCSYTVCICDECYNMGQSIKKRWKDASQYGNDNLYQNYHRSVISLTIPNTVTNIDDYAFGGQKKLNRINFASGRKLDRIGNYAFAGTAVTKLTMPASVKTIGNNAFRECGTLTQLTFNGNAVSSIGENAFIEHNLTEIVIPASCTYIGNYAFADGNKLKTVTIKSNNVDGYKKTLFDGTTIKKFYVNNYSIYNKLKKMFTSNIVLLRARVISNQTLIHVQHNGYTKNIYLNKNQTLDYCEQCTFDVGKKLDYATVKEINNFNGGEVSEKTANTRYYKANGAPEVYINVNAKEITYKIINNTKQDFIKNQESHYACEIKNKSEGTYCYFDEITFADISLEDSKKRAGYTITGYNINGREYFPGETAYGFGSSEEIVCDYYYDPIMYSVRFDLNGGHSSFIVYPQNCVYGERYNLPTTIPVNENLKFEGWSTNEQGVGTIYKTNDTFENLTTEDGETVTLYAVWSNNPVNISLKIDDNVVKHIKLNVGKHYSDIADASREGYIFVGWRDADGNLKSKEDNIDNFDHTLTASWRKINVYVNLYANGGELTGDSWIKVSYGNKARRIKNPKRTGYIFDGWYTAKTGGIKFNKNTVLKRNINLYAHWKKINVELSVKPKGLKKAKGYQIKCTVNGRVVYSKKLKKKNKKSIIYKFKKVGAGDKLVMKVRCYKIVKKRGKKKTKWYKWTTNKLTVGF